MNNGTNEVWAALKVALPPHPIHHLCFLMLVSTHPSALFKLCLQKDICLLSVIGTTFLKLTIHTYKGQINHSCPLVCLFHWLKASKRRGNHSEFYFLLKKNTRFFFLLYCAEWILTSIPEYLLICGKLELCLHEWWHLHLKLLKILLQTHILSRAWTLQWYYELIKIKIVFFHQNHMHKCSMKALFKPYIGIRLVGLSGHAIRGEGAPESAKAQKPCWPRVAASVVVGSKVSPLNIKDHFHVAFILNGSLYSSRNLKSSPVHGSQGAFLQLTLPLHPHWTTRGT